ncbi:adenosylcobinamide-phosphate synthase CbiB [Nocardioides acrostichi]|uniref:Cobalamin biosynthesis protein CobD n=1 Tax=Nocardioides acrostichi TaxID=2784339 RepID=A0A930V2H9_9ACTN|nr:adenosylcobinamide-phosphate synthase CbiB [Nocardioides acrostichi]MBF4162691.1 cobalamin biosynthesis protein CobD [Nocardioides acrostichi]
MSPRAVGLLAGFVLDAALGDPARHHPVAWFGTVAGRLECRLWHDRRGWGVAYVAVLVGGVVVPAAALERRLGPVPRAAATALATWTVLGGTGLDREAAVVQQRLEAGDLPGARARVGRIVGRATADLDEAGVARACVESVAENTADAVVGSLVWGGLLGLPGLVGHRAVNTLDAMVGHRSPRYARFGWAAARLDDVAGVPGSRLTALLATFLGPSPAGAVRAWRHDAAAHPSPNAGPVEAAFAGALGVTLGGANDYGGRVEHRARLGDGPPPAAADVARARALARRVDRAAVLVCGLLAVRDLTHRGAARARPARRRRR